MNASVTIPVSIAKDLLTGAEWSPADTRGLLQRTADIKARPSRFTSVLRGKHIALIFEKPSLRTRVTFEVGIQSMGGDVVFLDHTQARLGERESIPDVARNLECWVQGIVARVYEQRALRQIPSLSGARRLFHTRGKVRRAERLQAGLRRRRQQCLSLTFIPRRAPRRELPHRHTGKLRSRTGRSLGRQARCQGKPRAHRAIHQSLGSGCRCASRLHRFLDQHGLRGRREGTPQRLQGLPGQSQAHGASRARRLLYALPSGAPRRGSDRRSARRPGVHRAQTVRKPYVRAKGHPARAVFLIPFDILRRKHSDPASPQTKESRSRLFRRLGYFHHYSVAPRELWL